MISISRILKIFLYCILLQVSVYSQSSGEFKLPPGLSLSNQLKYSYDTDIKREILENFLNIDYRYSGFTTGLRFEVFQPNDPNPAISRGKEKFAGIDFRYISFNTGFSDFKLEVTAGNYYTQFGKGMVIKIYEDRNLRIDNNLEGLYVKADYGDLSLQALTGSAANSQNERTDILHAFDLEYRLNENIAAGITVASNSPPFSALSKTQVFSGRIIPSLFNLDFYAEYAVIKIEDLQKSILNDAEKFWGTGFYSSFSTHFSKLAVNAEYKYYDNFSFYSFDKTILYNTPPAVRKDYSFLLFNRHPSPLFPENETGYLIDLFYSLGFTSSVTLAYSETKSLGENSLYQKYSKTNNKEKIVLREIFGLLDYQIDKDFSIVFGGSYQEEAESNTKNLTGVALLTYKLTPVNTVKIIVEHQQTENTITTENYYTDVLTLEYLTSPNWSISLVSEMKTTEPDAGKIVRQFWNFLQLSYKTPFNTDLNLLLGSRQAGVICIGGVCRYEPEFRGIELKAVTRL